MKAEYDKQNPLPMGWITLAEALKNNKGRPFKCNNGMAFELPINSTPEKIEEIAAKLKAGRYVALGTSERTVLFYQANENG